MAWMGLMGAASTASATVGLAAITFTCHQQREDGITRPKESADSLSHSEAVQTPQRSVLNPWVCPLTSMLCQTSQKPVCVVCADGHTVIGAAKFIGSIVVSEVVCGPVGRNLAPTSRPPAIRIRIGRPFRAITLRRHGHLIVLSMAHGLPQPEEAWLTTTGRLSCASTSGNTSQSTSTSRAMRRCEPCGANTWWAPSAQECRQCHHHMIDGHVNKGEGLDSTGRKVRGA